MPAPDADWEEITGQVLSVYKALIDQGVPRGQISFPGDSAGGGIAAGSILRIRDSGLQCLQRFLPSLHAQT